MFTLKTSLKAAKTSLQNTFNFGHSQNMWVWLAVRSPQLLQHELWCCGPILETTTGVLKYLVITFHLNSLHVLELVTDCAPIHTSHQSSSDITELASVSHFSLICVLFLSMDEKMLYSLEIIFPFPSPVCSFSRYISKGVGFVNLFHSSWVVKNALSCKYLKKFVREIKGVS